ncbi:MULTISPECIES: YajG family lipoprotein [unclassified Arsenophonus]|uniref:YajG family lipoprotein n=1 Tax=unclassified Arsenophonus TaxID=2627083 RepID=UPI00285E5DB2|nr:YajG family lipoprotein [Arsenophonus sp.]MDR5609437.1 YajG family lipoprotein [Arsenophonus sp.]MDR5613096.1 YajG family lipoprotein [Arsenophonus sp.]
MLKNTFHLIIALLISLSLIGCVAPSNTLSIEPNITLPTQDPTIRAVSINITSIDKRSSTALAEVNRNAALAVLKPSRDLRYLLQEALEKQMIARGYTVSAPANINLQIALNKLYADVQEGSLRHNITVDVAISVVAMASNGSTGTRTYTRSYNEQGPLDASNEKIASALNKALTDIIADMANDPETSQFIKQNAQ